MTVRAPSSRQWPSLVLSIVAAAVVFVIVWKAIVVVGDYPIFILPRARTRRAAFRQRLVRRNDGASLPATLSEIVVGFLVGATLAVVVGYLLARSALAERLLSPYLVAAQATPILVLAPLLVVWLGTGLLPKVVICALIVFFPVAVATMVGIRIGR